MQTADNYPHLRYDMIDAKAKIVKYFFPKISDHQLEKLLQEQKSLKIEQVSAVREQELLRDCSDEDLKYDFDLDKEDELLDEYIPECTKDKQINNNAAPITVIDLTR